jgi:hypothetical protein
MASEKKLREGERARSDAIADHFEVLSFIEEQAKTIAQITKSGRSAKKGSPLKTVRELRLVLDRLLPTVGQLNQLEQHWLDQADLNLLHLEGNFRDVCHKNNWRVEGQWPVLFVERGIGVEFDIKKRIARVGGKMVEADPETIAAVLMPLVPLLVPKGFSPQQFISELALAYDEIKANSTQVAVSDVYRALVIRTQAPRFWRDARSDAFVPLTADQFRARLSRTLEEVGMTTTDGRLLRTLPPVDAREGIFVYQPAEARFGFIGRVEFASPSQKVTP